MPEKYPFRDEYQKQALSLLLRDNQFVKANRDLIRPGYFDNYFHASLCRHVLKFFDTYGRVPSESSLEQYLIEKVRDDSDLKFFLGLLGRLYHSPLDSDYVKENMIRFARQQEVRRALMVAKGMNAEGRFDDIHRLISKATLIGSEANDLGTSLFDTVEETIDQLNPEVLAETKLPTLISSIDRVLNGGVDRGEINLMMAPPEAGKSIWLVNMAFAGLFQGKDVLFVSCEMSEDKIKLRLNSRITGIPLYDMYSFKKSQVEKMQYFRENSGELKVKQYPTRQATVNDVRRLLDNLRNVEGFVPDLLVVDYLDDLDSTQHHERRYDRLGAITQELRGLAGEYGLYLWSATQGNRGSDGKKILSKKDKADSWMVIMDADVILGLMRTDEEQLARKGRLVPVKTRDGDKTRIDTKVIEVGMDYPRMYIGDLEH